MKFLVALIAAAGLAAPVFSQDAPARPEPCRHVRTSFDFVVHASYAETAPLFGPNGERAWESERWDPQFIHPQPATDVEGAVFTVRHGPYSEIWVNTIFDMNKRHFQYAYFMPGLMVTVVDVRFKPVNSHSTAVHVVFSRTAITPEGNERVNAMSENDRKAPKEWVPAIEAYLAHRTTRPKP
jgi:hypothetical protein